MQIRVTKLVYAVAGAALLAGAFGGPASATTTQTTVHHKVVHHTHHAASHDIVVNARPAPPDAFHGPLPIVTAPVAMAGTIVSLPFRFVEVFFPHDANDPRVVVGAPVHLAWQIAALPFTTINSAFGVPGTLAY